jgi:hypothetical protein
MRKFALICCLLTSFGFSLSESPMPEEIYVVHLESPLYDPLARQTRAQGDVSVQVRIDESGRVTSAHATTGHPLLVRVAESNIKTWAFNRGEERIIEIVYQFHLEEPEVYYDPPSRVTFDLPHQVRIVSNFKQVSP